MRFKFSPDAVTEAMAAGLYDLRSGSRIIPMRLFVYPTALCNDKCRYCSDSLNAEQNTETRHLRYDPRKDLFADKENVRRLAADVKKFSVRDIHLFGGGEPFFYKENMFYFLESLRDTDVFIRVITNANALDDQDVERIVRDRLVSQLNISFNTDCEETASSIYSSPGRHGHTLQVLSALTRYKNIYSSGYPSVDIMFTILKNNYDRIPAVVGNLRGHRIHFFFFQRLRCYTEQQRALAAPSLPQEDLKAAGRMLEEMGITSNISELAEVEGHPAGEGEGTGRHKVFLRNRRGLPLACYMPFTTLSICYNGAVPVCQFKYEQQFAFNYLDSGGLAPLLKSGEYSSFVSSFFGKETLPDICGGCRFCVDHESETLRKRFEHFDSLRKR
jgi:MoaA/NifB/PqqE/SkfB family radical SAM enzyme